jgi:hypothetical protein
MIYAKKGLQKEQMISQNSWHEQLYDEEYIKLAEERKLWLEACNQVHMDRYVSLKCETK